jgi:hypothetical protein
MSPTRVLSTSAQEQFRFATPSNAPLERRQHRRYPIIAQADYLLPENRGQATTVDMSSGGVLLKTKARLPFGHSIQILIDWPALLEQRYPLRLVIFGHVLRSNATEAVVTIQRYEFRLRPRSAATGAP